MVEKGHLGSLPLTKSVPATPILVAGPMNGVWPRSPSLLICACHIAQAAAQVVGGLLWQVVTMRVSHSQFLKPHVPCAPQAMDRAWWGPPVAEGVRRSKRACAPALRGESRLLGPHLTPSTDTWSQEEGTPRSWSPSLSPLMRIQVPARCSPYLTQT